MEPYAYRADPQGAVYAAVYRTRRIAINHVLYAFLIVAGLFVLVLLLPDTSSWEPPDWVVGVIGIIPGFSLLAAFVFCVMAIAELWTIGGISMRRWEAPEVRTLFVVRVGEVFRDGGESEDWLHWLNLDLLPRRLQPGEVVAGGYVSPKIPRDLVVNAERVAIRGGVAASPKKSGFENQEVAVATSSDGAITLISVIASGEVFRCNSVPLLMQPLDWVRDRKDQLSSFANRHCWRVVQLV